MCTLAISSSPGLSTRKFAMVETVHTCDAKMELECFLEAKTHTQNFLSVLCIDNQLFGSP